MFSTEAQKLETIEKLLTTQILNLPQAVATALAPKILDLCDNNLTVPGLQSQIKVLIATNAPRARQDQAHKKGAALTESGLVEQAYKIATALTEAGLYR